MKKTGNILTLLIFLALFLRVVGITHGFPFILHPDEPTLVRSALGVRFDPNPAHFDWPHLMIYIYYFVFMVFAKLRNLISESSIAITVKNFAPIIWDDVLIYYLIGRLISAVLGALTVIPIYLSAKNLFNEKAGLIAAFTIAVLPYHVVQSHYSLPDIPMIFFMCWGIYFSTNILVSSRNIHYSKSGFFMGLAASSKYNGGLSSLLIPWAHLLRIVFKNNKELGSTNDTLLNINGYLNLLSAVFFAVLGFLMGTPYAILDRNTFLRDDGPKGAIWQFKNVGKVDLIEWFPKFLSDMSGKVFSDVGNTVLIGFGIVLLLLIVRLITKKTTKHDLANWFLVIPGLLLLVYVSSFAKVRSQYYLVAYPYLVLTFSYFVYELFTLMELKTKWLSLFILGVLLFPPFYSGVFQSYTFFNGDTLAYLYRWSKSNIPANSVIIYDHDYFAPLFTKLPNTNKRGADQLAKYSTGYFFDAVSDTSVQERFNILSTMGRFNKFEEVYREDNGVKRGPNFVVYKFAL